MQLTGMDEVKLLLKDPSFTSVIDQEREVRRDARDNQSESNIDVDHFLTNLVVSGSIPSL